MNVFAWKFYEHYRDRNHVFTELIGSAPNRFRVTANGGDEEVVVGEYVSGRFFRRSGSSRPSGGWSGPMTIGPAPATRQLRSSAGRTGTAAGSGRRRSSAAGSPSRASR